MTIKAIVLLSGGLDSTVVLALALSKGRECMTLTLDYQQRNILELEAAKRVAAFYDVPNKLIIAHAPVSDRSSLISSAKVPKDRTRKQIYQGTIPNTYVPGRNTLFLAYALGQAETFDAQEIYYGVNATDVIGYPDARPAYFKAFQNLLNVATQQAVEGAPPRLMAPLTKLYKQDIVKQGIALEAPLHLTLSCYDPSPKGMHCGRCDACYLRKEGFLAAGYPDPTCYSERGFPLEAAEISSLS